ncbi:hypothetical protein PAPYR_11166 [Paratrimastix pyriformis]|uniref:Uncharacterized protein n=1 Tax=Paratrimastix pyriformis TaxID=342808 RepID=A0ABQ8U895_9EUKA|nr:hypothetical protein PAPYR_11166 [Paratrimastix pyriformis]
MPCTVLVRGTLGAERKRCPRAMRDAAWRYVSFIPSLLSSWLQISLAALFRLFPLEATGSASGPVDPTGGGRSFLWGLPLAAAPERHTSWRSATVSSGAVGAFCGTTRLLTRSSRRVFPILLSGWMLFHPSSADAPELLPSGRNMDVFFRARPTGRWPMGFRVPSFFPMEYNCVMPVEWALAIPTL